MKKKSILIIVTLFLASAGISHAATAEDLLQKYSNAASSGQKVKILIVPGHDDEYWGTEFRGVKEADVTVDLGQRLYTLLSQDPRLEVLITRTKEGYTPTFANYFRDNREAIQTFYQTKKNEMAARIQSGITVEQNGVAHNNANPEVAIRLYGINKWANENNVDIIYHIHINDNPSRPSNNPGYYQGFAMYVPEGQYAHANVSQVFAQSMFPELYKYYATSNLPGESTGIAVDQDLIAIGASNTVTNAATVLTEYGYIYEPQYLNETVRGLVVKDLAFQTFLGFRRFFGDEDAFRGKYDTPLLPYTWQKGIAMGTLFNADVLALQAALRKEKLYPPTGQNTSSCRMTGNFDFCTRQALIAFQRKYKIPTDATSLGTFGPKTRAKFNLLFGK
jgi:N-acetylmuramoyl-L-alanine amidase